MRISAFLVYSDCVHLQLCLRKLPNLQEVKEEPAPQAAPSKPVTNETTAVDLQGAMKKKQKLSEELKAVEKQVNI